MSKLKTFAAATGFIALAFLSAPAFAGFTPPADTAVTLVPTESRLTIGGVFTHAKPLIILIFAGLIVSIAYAAFVYIRGVMARRDQQIPGLTFLSALSAGGPMIGLFGASYGLLDMCIGIANKRPSATLIMLAPGYAEAMLCICLGLLAGAVALVGHRHLSGRMLSAAKASAAAPAAPPAPLARAAL